MKFFAIALLALSSLSAANLADSEHPRTPKRVWIRRWTLAAGCAASLAFDTWSTHRAVHAGAFEGNGLFANSHGQPQWGRTFAIKAASCGASFALQETHTFHSWESPASDWTWSGINAGAAGIYSWASWHNLRLSQK